MAGTAKPVVLLLADISGYTRFMLRHRTDETHSQVIVSELVGELVRAVEPPLEVAKLEGDAVFVFAVRGADEAEWSRCRAHVGAKTLELFSRFLDKVAQMQGATICRCGACRNLDKLRLKVIAHAGQAVFHRLGRFDELHGVDVIIVHRLAKNSVESDHYLLVSDAARAMISFPEEVTFVEGEERYEDVGAIRTHVHYRHGELCEVPRLIRQRGHGTLLRKVRHELRLIGRTLLHETRLRRLPAIRVG
ncbi:MAG: DUF2652 domain-containing protein [Candidatus Sumerlaeia bacterium]|nr:DUF2652 domain-containing protein [Candidatus Sumerlaeia bacterium]